MLGTNPCILYIVFIKTLKELCYDYTFIIDEETEEQQGWNWNRGSLTPESSFVAAEYANTIQS